MTWVTFSTPSGMKLTGLYRKPPGLVDERPVGVSLGGYLHDANGFMVMGRSKPIKDETVAKQVILALVATEARQLADEAQFELAQTGTLIKTKPKNKYANKLDRRPKSRVHRQTRRKS